jgi:hypothetical protein
MNMFIQLLASSGETTRGTEQGAHFRRCSASVVIGCIFSMLDEEAKDGFGLFVLWQ